MLANINSAVVVGLEAIPVKVEVDVSNGLPNFDIVGLPDKAVKEARERVRAAIKNSGFEFPMQRITVNLAPADLKKEGVVLDVALALGILAATGQVPEASIEGVLAVGELSLDGSIRGIKGVLSIAMMVKTCQTGGLKYKLVIPVDNFEEGSLVEEITLVPAKNLLSLVGFWQGTGENYLISQVLPRNNRQLINEVDFAEVKGQSLAKRGLEIAAAGGHNLLMVGSPGSGKTMLASRLTTIMPAMSTDEALEVTKVYSVAGLLPKGQPLILNRPFRAPHHTASAASIIGGGRLPAPGEISLAHHGILFMDEFPEFKRDVLEALRQPLEEGSVMISRVSSAIRYPAKIMLVAAMNPCPCGFLGDSKRECLCSPLQVMRYRSRLSGPLLDRIELHVDVPRLEIEDLLENAPAETSEEIRRRVVKARQVQKARNSDHSGIYNANMGPREIKAFCHPSKEALKLLKLSFNKLNLSARSYNKVLKVARTIADLGDSEEIDTHHIAEALQFRTMDKKYWN